MTPFPGTLNCTKILFRNFTFAAFGKVMPRQKLLGPPEIILEIIKEAKDISILLTMNWMFSVFSQTIM
jgi:hypothetical protein